MNGHVLVVGLERQHYKELLPLLSRSLLDVERLASCESALHLTERVALDLILVRYPLPDMALGSFMQQVRAAGSPCATTPFVVLADAARLPEIRALLPGGGRDALDVSEPAKVLAHVAALLKLAPRADVRVPVKLQVRLGGEPPLQCETENVSEKGLLLRSEEQLPLGTRVAFELTLPGERLPIQGEAEVARHAETDVEQVRGMGLKVVLVKGDGTARLRRFVSR